MAHQQKVNKFIAISLFFFTENQHSYKKLLPTGQTVSFVSRDNRAQHNPFSQDEHLTLLLSRMSS